MSDFLMEMGKKSWFRKAVKSTGMPIPTPLELKRQGPRADPAPFQGRAISLFSEEKSPLHGTLLKTLAACTDLTLASSNTPISALIFDGSSLEKMSDMASFYDFFHTHIALLEKHGRVLILTHTQGGNSQILQTTLARALEGAGRSLAKEVGKKGISVNTLHVNAGAESNLPGPLRFFLSRASAYVTGQNLTLSPHTQTGDWDTLPVMYPLQGKTALVTGAARGIGAETARVLAGHGAKVMCLDRPDSEADLQALCEEIEGIKVTLDVTDENAGLNLVSAVKAHLGKLDIVVHNAGVTRDKTLKNMKKNQWDLVLSVNLEAIINLTSDLLKESMGVGARFVCVSSVSGIGGNMGQVNYAASKAGLLGYVSALAQAINEKGMRINAVAPGFIETPMTDAMPTLIREGARRMNSFSQGGKPEDVAQAIAFLAGPSAAGLSGQHLRICGQAILGA